MEKKLVIVESPTKARTISQILGPDFIVKASLGHIRDLPEDKLGVDIRGGFKPYYVIPEEKKKVVNELKEAADKATSLYLATDPDREGEAIAWHLVQILDKKSIPTYRVILHEITPQAVRSSFHSPRSIDENLVESQQARRILDRLVGYKLSPLLWRKVKSGLSAGRVQSSALRMLVEREREIENFIPREFWTIQVELKSKGQSFRATLSSDSNRLEVSKEEVEAIVQEIREAIFTVSDLITKELRRNPPPPFTTSTLQQEASRKLGFSAEQTMFIAQQLYEGLEIGEAGIVGLITYMRTDATRVSPSFISEVRDYISKKYEPSFLPEQPRVFTQKAKLAQEAHEAIRPTNIWREPHLIQPFLTPQQFKLYELIWKRMVASQMSSARYKNLTAIIKAEGKDKVYNLRASSSQLLFPGFMVVYLESEDEEEEGEGVLPLLTIGEELELVGIFPEQHFTKPPPRFTEASLIKALEERGIGRPSTYAPIISTLLERGYVEKRDGKLYPQKIGILVNDLLCQYFPRIVDLDFTAQMEEELDAIARGEKDKLLVLKEFYTPFERDLKQALHFLPKVKIEEEKTGENCPSCGKPMIIKRGRFGKFLSCSSFPNCKERKPYIIKIGAKCPLCDGEIVEREGKKGSIFYCCSNFPACKFAIKQKPLPSPCPQCGGVLVIYRRNWAKCFKCSHRLLLKEIS